MLSKVYIKVSEFVSNPIVTVNNVPYVYGSEYTSGSLITIKITATNYQDYVKTLVVPENNILIKINPIDLSNYVTLNTDQTIYSTKNFKNTHINEKYDISEVVITMPQLDTTNSNKHAQSRISLKDSNNYARGYVWTDSWLEDNKMHYSNGLTVRANNTSNHFYISVMDNPQETDVYFNGSSALLESIGRLAFPSGTKSIDLTLGAPREDHLVYTHYRPGWAFIQIRATADIQHVYFSNIGYPSVRTYSNHGELITALAPIRRSEYFKYYHNVTNPDLTDKFYFRFYYLDV